MDSYLGQSVCWHGRCFLVVRTSATSWDIGYMTRPAKRRSAMKMTKVLLLSAATLAFAALPASAQLRGGLGSTVGGTLNGAGNTLGGTLNTNHTANAGGGQGVGLGSTIDGTVDGTLSGNQDTLGNVTGKVD